MKRVKVNNAKTRGLDKAEQKLSSLGLMAHKGYAHVMDCFHRHDEVELNFAVEGSITYLHAGRRVTVPAGRLAIFWAAIPHKLTSLKPKTTTYWVTLPLSLFLSWKLPQDFVHQIMEGYLLIEPDGAQGQRDRLMIDQWVTDLQKSNTPSSNQIEACLHEIHGRLIRLSVSQPGSAKIRSERTSLHTGHVDQMARFIAENYTQPIHVQQVADSVQLHPNYAMNLFSKVLGVSINDCIIRHRLSHAQRLLASTDRKIIDIAMDAGFGSLSRFYAVMSEHHGISPRHYRRKIQGFQ
ncbi:MAG: helix-turn-helix domain-containing protein [Verrucomicrobiota bacterium]|nr:helix-turn-helix domain-containing protein [Verrucomicrobiota bacterium]